MCYDKINCLQAMEANDEKLSKSMLFPLAEKMVAKFVDEGKIDAEAGDCV